MSRTNLLQLLALLGMSAFLVAGVGRVPFHPDETSLLFQSRDLEQYFSDPLSMAWSPDQPLTPERRYRALNAPLAKYVLGIGRLLAGYSAASVEVDWDWTLDWQANLDRGALPPTRLLDGARLASTLLLPVALLFTYLVGRRLAGDTYQSVQPATHRQSASAAAFSRPGKQDQSAVAAGLLSAALLGLNALFLLHGRRAMMEGALFFGLCFALWAMLAGDRRPWLAGIALGIALSAKHSLLPLLPVGMLAALWRVDRDSGQRLQWPAAGKVLLAAALIFGALNPLLWKHPLGAVATIIDQRAMLAESQLQTQRLADYAAMQLPMSATDRLASLLGQVFFSSPQFSEAANYRAAIADQVSAYLRLPGQNWLRGWLAGGVLLMLTLYGALMAVVSLRRLSAGKRRDFSLLLLATAATAAALLVGVPFPFQRYYLPMLPFVALWAAYAAIQLVGLSKRLLSARAA